MHLPTLALVFIAATAAALPTSTVAESDLQFDERDILEIVKLERKAFLSARDVELAARHGADANEMFPHSMVRRRNGDDITIWVNNNFVEGEASETLDKRQAGARPNEGALTPQGSNGQTLCRTYVVHPEPNLTRPESAFSGGATAIARWGRNTPGFFTFGPHSDAWTDVVIGGSNSGANARFSISRGNVPTRRIGTGDVDTVVSYIVPRFRKNYGGSWRVAGEGYMTCPGSANSIGTAYGTGFELKKTDKRV